MILHNFTLEKILSLCSGLIGLCIGDIFSQEKDTIIINFEGMGGTSFLEISCDGNYSGIFLRDNFARAKKNSVDLFPSLTGKHLLGMEIINKDRIIRLEFEGTSLYLFLFGRGTSSILLADEDKRVIDSFGGNNIIIGSELSLPDKFHNKKANANISDFINDYIYLGKHYLRLFFVLHPEYKSLILNDMGERVKEEIRNDIANFKNLVLMSESSFLYKTPNGYLFSLVELPFLDSPFTEHESLFRAISLKISFSKRDKRFSSQYKPILADLSRQFKRAEKNYAYALEYKSSRERESKYRHFGELLLSQENQRQAVGKSIILKNWDGVEQEIQTDSKLNILQNAMKYFKKSKRAKLEAENKQKNLLKFKQKRDLCFAAKSEIDEISELKSLNKFVIKYEKVLNLHKSNEDKTPAQKFRHFNVEGWDFYVGRNAKNNDELTTGFAKARDLWFHARGASGSHCVLSVNTKERVPKNIIKKCAEISAYYSGSRNAKYTPVIYVEKKHVRKPKGANPGSVFVLREEVIMVEPRLPNID